MTDEIIQFYADKLINQYSVLVSNNLPFKIVSPQIYLLMMWSGEFSYEQVRFQAQAWKDIFCFEKIIFPVNKNSNHWMVVTVYPKQRQIQMFDSMGQSDTSVAQNILKLIKAEYAAKHKGEALPNEHAWEVEDCKRNEPRQINGKLLLQVSF